MKKLLTFAVGIILGFSGVSFAQHSEPLLGGTVLFPSGGGTGRGSLDTGKYLTGNGTGAVTFSTCVDITGSADLCDGSDATGSGGNSFEYPFPSNATSTSIAFNGGLTGVLTGSLVGNADTATKLATARAINGVNFDGSAAITIFAASSTLLANNNTFSGTNTFSNTITGSITGNAGTANALAANGANCPAGFFPLGVNASGVSETCTYAFATTSPWSTGIVAVGTAGAGYTVASSSLFGYTPLNPTRQITIAGTANQITSSAGAQDLSADRTWTLSIPTDFRVTSTTITGATLLTNATTTNLYVSGQTRLASLSGLLKAATGVISTASNGTDFTLVSAQTCTNQVITALTASGGSTCSSVSNAMLTNSSLTVNGQAISLGSSGTITAASSTLLANNNTWSGLNVFGNASTTQFSAASQTFYIDSTGKVQFKDTANNWSGTVTPTRYVGLQTGTTTTWTATTSGEYVPLATLPFAGTLRSVTCTASSSAAFLVVMPYINQTSVTPTSFIASSTEGIILFTANNTFSAGDVLSFYAGTTTASTANKTISCTFGLTQT